MNGPAFEDLGCRSQVFESSAGAGPKENLVNTNPWARLSKGPHPVGLGRKRHTGDNGIEVDDEGCILDRWVVGDPIGMGQICATLRQPIAASGVNSDNARHCPHLDRVIAELEARCHIQRPYSRPDEFQGFAQTTTHADST